MEARLRPILYRIAVSLGLMKPYSLHHSRPQSYSLSSFLSPLSALLYTERTSLLYTKFSPLRRACQSAVTLCQYGKSAGCVWPRAFRQSDNLTTIKV